MALDAKTLAEMDAILAGGAPASDGVDIAAMDAALAQPQYSEPSTTGEAIGQLATGVVKGIPNLIDFGGAALATGIDKATGMSGKNFGDTFQQYAQQKPLSTAVDAGLSQLSQAVGGTPIEERKPAMPIGRYANMAGQGMATVPLFAASTVGNLVRGGLGGFGSEFGGDVGQSVGGDAGRAVGSIGGAILGGTAPDIAGAVTRPIGPMTQRAQSAFQKKIAPTLAPDTAVLAKRAQDLDVPLSLTQVAPSRTRNTVQKVSQAVPFSGVQAFEEGQKASWNKALSKTIGLDVDKLTPESVKDFITTTSKRYDEILKDKAVTIGEDAIQGIKSIADEAPSVMEGSLARVVKNNVTDVLKDIGNGTMTGEKANSIRKMLERRASMASGEVKDAIGQIATNFMDSIKASLPIEEAQKLATVNRHYRNFKTMEPLLEKSVEGSIDPTALLQRVASSKFIKAARQEVGDDDLIDLARIGKMMPKLGGSDTFEKSGLAIGGAGAYAAPTTASAVVTGNRAYQKLYNQSQKILEKSIEKSLPKGLSKETMEKISGAIATGDERAIIQAAGDAETAMKAINVIKGSGGAEIRKEAFDLSKKINRKPDIPTIKVEPNLYDANGKLKVKK